jgi:hypothetical protein
MLKPLHGFVLDTLRNTLINRVNFRYGSLCVEPDSYRRDIAGLVESGSIRVTIDPAEAGLTEAQASRVDGSYVIDRRRGRVHPLFIHPRNCVVRAGEVFVREATEHEMAGMRGTVVHEATHALQDLRQVDLDPRSAEGSAYLAGAITARLWGYAIPPRGQVPHPYDAPQLWNLGIGLWLADRLLDQATPGVPYTVPADDVMIANSRVRTVDGRRYDFNGI